MSEDFVLEGQLSDICLPTILMSLHNDRETGILEISDDLHTKRLFVQEGRIVHASSTDPDEGLAECLLRRDLISLAHYLEVREDLQAETRGGGVPTAFRSLEPDRLQEGVEGRLRDLALSMLGMKVGRYNLRLAPFSAMNMMTLSTGIPQLLFELMQTMTCWGRIYAGVGDPDTRLTLSARLPAFVADLDMDTDQAHLMDLCRSGMPVSALVEASYMPPFQTYRLLWSFIILGLVVHLDNSGREEEGTTIAALEETLERYNDLYAYIHSKLAVLPGADALFGSMMAELAERHPRMAGRQDGLGQYGKLDVDLALWELRKLPEDTRARELMAFLDDVLDAFTSAAGSNLPPGAREDVFAYVRTRTGSPPGEQQ